MHPSSIRHRAPRSPRAALAAATVALAGLVPTVAPAQTRDVAAADATTPVVTPSPVAPWQGRAAPPPPAALASGAPRPPTASRSGVDAANERTAGGPARLLAAADERVDDPARDAADAARVQSLAGTVKLYLVNALGDVEGIVADDGTQVRFPPHMGADVVRTLRPGDRFAASGSGSPGRTFRAYALGKPGAAPLVEARPTPGAADGPPHERPRRAAPEPMRADGTIASLLRAPRGEVDGAVLDDGTIVRLPPRTGLVDLATLHVGTRLGATGYGTKTDYGRGMRAEQIAIDGGAPVALQPRGPEAPRPRAPRGPGADATRPAPPDDAPPR